MLLAQFSKVSKDYGSNPVFDDVDLEILEGERVGLVGENGSGWIHPPKASSRGAGI